MRKVYDPFFRAFFKRIPTKAIEYRNYSKFSPEAFLHELDQEINKRSSTIMKINSAICFQIFSEQF